MLTQYHTILLYTPHTHSHEMEEEAVLLQRLGGAAAAAVTLAGFPLLLRCMINPSHSHYLHTLANVARRGPDVAVAVAIGPAKISDRAPIGCSTARVHLPDYGSSAKKGKASVSPATAAGSRWGCRTGRWTSEGRWVVVKCCCGRGFYRRDFFGMLPCQPRDLNSSTHFVLLCWRFFSQGVSIFCSLCLSVYPFSPLPDVN